MYYSSLHNSALPQTIPLYTLGYTIWRHCTLWADMYSLIPTFYYRYGYISLQVYSIAHCLQFLHEAKLFHDASEQSRLTGNLDPCKGLERAIPISVIPHLSSNVCPKYKEIIGCLENVKRE